VTENKVQRLSFDHLPKLRAPRPLLRQQHTHVMNRRVDRTPLFGSRQQYDEFASPLG